MVSDFFITVSETKGKRCQKSNEDKEIVALFQILSSQGNG